MQGVVIFLFYVALGLSTLAGECIYAAVQRPSFILFGIGSLLTANALIAIVATGTLLAINFNKK